MPCTVLRYAVRKRIAVPAAMMSMVSLFSASALIITNVSSQSDRLHGGVVPRASALMMSARLLILLEAGSCIVDFTTEGADSL